MAPADRDVGPRLDALRVTQLHLAVFVLCSLGLGTDVLEIALGGVLSAVFSRPPDPASPARLGWLLGSVYIGAVLGSSLAGRFADRHGRPKIMRVLMVLLALTSLAAAVSPDITLLTVSRVLSGLALGAYPPVMVAYLTDLVPPNRRGMFVLCATTIAALCPPAVIFFIRWLSHGLFGVEAWRWGFVIGSLGAAGAAILFGRLPESPRWLQAMGRYADADAACRDFEASQPAWALKLRGSRRGSTACAEGATALAGPAVPPDASPQQLRAFLLGSLFFASAWSAAAFPMLNGAMLMRRGLRLSDTLFYVGITTFGPPVGTLLAAFVVDRVERRAALVVCAVTMALLGIAFEMSATPFAVAATSLMLGVSGIIYGPTLVVYAAELATTGSRARTTSRLWAVNRAGSALAPMSLLPLLRSRGEAPVFGIIALAMVGSIVLILFLPRGEVGRSVS